MSRIDERDYVAYQYSDSEKYLSRVETHRQYSEQRGEFSEWALDCLAPRGGSLLLDVGCGPGVYHAGVVRRGGRLVAVDLFEGMLSSTREAGDAWGLARASAEVLPFRDASFDYVMANHMLYHVDDQRSALREMRRVLKSAGRALLTTSAANNMSDLYTLHEEACAATGLVPTTTEPTSRFTLSDAELVSEFFGHIRVEHRLDALVFQTADPLLKFYASFVIDFVTPLPEDGAHRPRLLAALRDIIDLRLELDGSIRIAKDAGCFVADV